MGYPDLADRLAQVREVITQRQAAAGWTHPVQIIGVVKTHGPEAVRAAHRAGLEAVAENRVQEALAKQAVLADTPVAWHLIGPLQRNKVRQVVGRFALLHAVDRPELVTELAKRVSADWPQPILLEVNCSGEAQKAGVDAEALPGLIDLVREHPQLELRGLMAMAPFTSDETVQRKVFRRLRSLQDVMQQRGIELPELSMGMSGDYPVAVEEGATMVRLGTVLFGERTS